MHIGRPYQSRSSELAGETTIPGLAELCKTAHIL
jgi:hypothetical protein